MNDKDALLKEYRELLTSLAWAKGKEPHPAKIARITAALEDGGWIKCSERLAQPERQWQGLTGEEVGALTVFNGLHHVEVPVLADFIRAVEAKIKEKNGG